MLQVAVRSCFTFPGETIALLTRRRAKRFVLASRILPAPRSTEFLARPRLGRMPQQSMHRGTRGLQRRDRAAGTQPVIQEQRRDRVTRAVDRHRQSGRSQQVPKRQRHSRRPSCPGDRPASCRFPGWSSARNAALGAHAIGEPRDRPVFAPANVEQSRPVQAFNLEPVRGSRYPPGSTHLSRKNSSIPGRT